MGKTIKLEMRSEVCFFVGYAKGNRAQEPLKLIHSDVCGPMSTQARGGYEYFVTFVDDYSRYGYVYLMRHKSETFGKFKEFQIETKKTIR